MAIEENVVEEYNKFCEGELETKAKVVGYLTVDIVLIVVPVSKIVKVSKASKLNKVLNKTKAVGKLKKGTSKAAIKSEMKAAIRGAGGASKFLDDALAKLYKKVPLGKGNTGRIIPITLNEQLAMKEVLTNPLKNAKGF